MKDKTKWSEEFLDNVDVPIEGISLADFDNSFLLKKERCPACGGPYVVPVRYVFHHDLSHRVLLRHCLECRSFWNAPRRIGQPAEADMASSVNETAHHLQIRERNTGMARNLFDQLQNIADFSSVLEIGCGIGTTLSVAAAAGKNVRGYDINSEAIRLGRKLFDLDLRDEAWTNGTVSEKFDLVLCIQTLEHFVTPLPMLRELATYARTMHSLLFISVPCIAPKHWPFLLDADPSDDASIFRFVSGHFTYFSWTALENAVSSYGCRLRYVPPSPTSPASWHGMLYDFRDNADWLKDAAGKRILRTSPRSNEQGQAETISRLANQEVYFWGCGDLYQAKKHLFASARPRCILSDDEYPEQKEMDGLPICHPEDILSWGGDILPIVVFEKDANFAYRMIRERWPHYTDLIFCG